MNKIFSSSENYKANFNKGLVELAQDDSLGTFILAMANATFSNDVYAVTKDYLHDNFEKLRNKYTGHFSEGRKVNEDDEDLLVFLKMICVGFEKLKTTVFRDESGWEVQFNHLRGFRPNRISQEKIDNLVLPFNAAGFNFNKPFMAKEILWEGNYNKQQLSLFYNKYPFADYHTLLVPEREKGLPQFLELEQHEYIWQFISEVGENKDVNLFAAEKKIMGITHIDIGKMVMRMWNMPEELIEVASHISDKDYAGEYEKYIHLLTIIKTILVPHGLAFGDSSDELPLHLLEELSLDEEDVIIAADEVLQEGEIIKELVKQMCA